MTRIALAVVLAATLTPIFACAPAEQAGGPASPGSTGERSGEVVATLQGEEIRQSELREYIEDQLYEQAVRGKSPQDLAKFQRESLEHMINDRLVRAEAERLGTTPDALYEQTVGDIEVDDEEVQRFYDANRGRMPEGIDFAAVAPRIRQMLTEQTRIQTWTGYVRALQAQADHQILIEIPRIDVAAVGPAKGPEGAPVTIVEFSDFNCPFCQRVTPTLAEVMERYPDEVRVVFRHFPLESIHPRARPTAEAAVCADEQGEFWAFHDEVFAADRALEDDDLLASAQGLGLDVEAFQACLADGRAAEIVQRDLDAGREAGINSTPSFFVNGVPLSGALGLDAFVEVIEAELARGETPTGEAAS